MWQPMQEIRVELDEILQALRAKKIAFVLTGAHGMAGWTGRPRATHDVDILVRAGRTHARAVSAIKKLYPGLEVRQLAGVTAFFQPGTTASVIDITFPHRADQEVTLQTGVWVGSGAKKYRVPSLEAALANKYGAMLTLSRDPLKRAQDAVDFAAMVKHSTDAGRTPIDEAQLESLGEKVWPGGGGKEILFLMRQAKAGKVPNVSTPGSE
jgi:hypothetical protein